MRARVWVPCLFTALVVGGLVLLVLPREQAEAGFTSEATKDLVKYAKSGAALNLRLQALEAIRKRNETGIEAELESLARGSDRVLAVYSCTTLGRKNTTAAKSSLKALFESGSTDKMVRKSAMTAIAVHWKDADDLSYFDSKTTGDSDLRAHYLFLKSKIYRR